MYTSQKLISQQHLNIFFLLLRDGGYIYRLVRPCPFHLKDYLTMSCDAYMYTSNVFRVTNLFGTCISSLIYKAITL